LERVWEYRVGRCPDRYLFSLRKPPAIIPVYHNDGACTQRTPMSIFQENRLFFAVPSLSEGDI
ncbi:MAG: hypothetical protein ABI865_13865, partial [Nitrosospira sp.]